MGGVFFTWQAQFTATGIHLSGSGITDGGVLLVTFSGTAGHVGTLPFVTVTHAADGTMVRWAGPPTSKHPAALVYVLASLTNPAALSLPGRSGQLTASTPPWWALGAALVGLVALIGCVVTSWRPRRSGKISRAVSIRGRGDRH